ncbi:GAF domain-containing protein [Microbacterium sp. Mu-80]|uniref:GAF domain-containing protein n=1 Tax=Microbacterium bandirmense TaxID=3122050 RepID=A0ABU8LEP4_9MICO
MSSDLVAALRAIGEGAGPDPERLRSALPNDPAAADALVELAHRVEGLRQRGAELRAVMSSAKDLLSISDVELLLQRIVDRAHELVGVDIAYLSVYDGAKDELYVRATSGTVSPRFPQMVVPAGVGLASLAVRTRHPQWVEDYALLTSVPHDPTIDAIVGEEQLRSLLGAPLVVGDGVLGVLFAASREPHTFRPEEVSLLTTFAGHAALVLHQAQLLREATDATAESAAHQQRLEWAAALHGELTRLVLEGRGADAVAGVLADALGREVMFVDAEGRSVAHTGPARQLPGSQIRAAISKVDDSGASVMLGSGPVEFVAPVAGSTGRHGALLIARGREPLSDVQRRTIERSAITAALLVVRRDALDDAEERVRGEIADELFVGGALGASALRRARTRGYPVDQAWELVVIVCGAEDRRRLRSALRVRRDWLVALGADGVAVLAPGVDAARHVVDELGEATSAVFSRGATLVDALAAASATWRSARLARGLELPPGIVDAVTLAPYDLLFGDDGQRLSEFVDAELRPLRDWEQTRGTPLVATLAALFDHQWSLVAAARALHVHLNTLKQRVRRLESLLGDDLQRPEARFRLELAVRIEIARGLGGISPMRIVDQ